MDALTIRSSQFKRLVTHEDRPYHAHKVLGALCLFHFAYRIFLGFVHGSMFFGERGTLLWIAMHSMLHATSFRFEVPNRRNKVYNVIWPEMRWHTAIFAHRSLIAMLIIWLADRGVVSPFASIAMRPPLVLGTMLLADGASAIHAATTTASNGSSTTMRGNPYPAYASPRFIENLNLFYAISQILATMNVMVATTPDRPFLTLLAIQTAPFGMTLVKKGVITQAGWHFWYTLALLMNYAYAAVVIERGALTMPAYVAISVGVGILRLRYRVNKYVLWTLAGAGILLLSS